MKGFAFSVFERGVWWFAAIKKRGLEVKVADNAAAFAFKADAFLVKASSFAWGVA